MSRVNFYKLYVGKKKYSRGSSHRDGLSTGFGSGDDVCIVQ